MMKKINILFLLIIFFSGCKNMEWAAKSQAVIHAKFPELEAENCAARFPPIKDSVVQFVTNTDTIYQDGETIWIECDSSLFARPVNAKTRSPQSQSFKCPPSLIIHRTDSVKTKITVENTARVESLKMQVDKATKKLSTWQVTAVILGCLLVISLIGLWLAIKKNGRNNNNS